MFLVFCFLGLLILKTLFSDNENIQFYITRLNRMKEMQKYMDRTVNPCDDFYQFACGNWESFNPIPEDTVDNNEYTKLDVKLLSQVKELLEEPIRASDSVAVKKTKQFYASCTNLDVLKKRGIRPLSKFLSSVAAWPLLDDAWSETDFYWLDVITNIKSEYGVNILLSARVFDNLRNITQNEIYIYETPTTLPNRDFYYMPKKGFQLNAYKEYMLDVLKLFGIEEDKVKNVSEEILQFESNVAMGTADANSRPNFQELLLHMTVGDLEINYPEINWQKFIERSLDISVNKSQRVTLVGDSYVPHLTQIISVTDKRVIANYIMWMIMQSFLEYTDDRFDAAEQRYAEAIVGSHEQAERWKNCVLSTKSTFGFVIGNMYIRKHFDEKTEKDVTALAELIKKTFRENLYDMSWIDNQPIERLQEKCEQMQLVVGYPEYIMSEYNLNKQYEDISIDPEKYFENTLNVLKNLQREERRKIKTEVDRRARFYPVTANAFYEVNRNRIIIPAGILQYPIYNRHFPKAINFGQIGAILGHELIHGFDDFGQNFDPSGNMINWRNSNWLQNFKSKVVCFVSQYNNYTYNGFKLQGKVSVGENIADLGGLRQAFYAYKNWLQNQM